jgi:alginate O-acetyltransferase complex protein AlgI
MLFNSWEFLALLLITFALYHLPVPGMRRKTWQVGLLLTASAVFYAWYEPRLLILLSASCLLNAVAVERILFWKNNQGTGIRGQATGGIRAKRWLFWTVALNLAFLAFFKYAGFLANLFPDTLIPVSCKHWLTDIPLPVGISFYTFQGISLVVDVWRNDISENTTESLSGRGKARAISIRDTSFYISFFPQLVAGPIVKAHEFVDQIGAKNFKDIDWITVRRGLVTGYFLKIFVADNLAEQTIGLSTRGTGLAESGPINLMSLLYGYSLQIFADFAGYSLIAIGLGALFGYKLPPNFNFPYLSCSITEFWRRWHLSLSSWLRDYLYFPLGGNRKGAGRTYFNLILVMFLGGLWHGAAWKFAIWGSLHGIFLALERICTRKMPVAAVCDRRSPGDKHQESGGGNQGSVAKDQKSKTRNLQHYIKPLRFTIPNPKSQISNLLISITKWFITFHLVTLLWLTFMMPDITSIVAFFKGVASGKLGFSGPPIFSLLFYGTMVVLYHAWGWLRENREDIAHKLSRSPIEAMLHGVMVFLVLTNPGAPRGFIYFQF